MVMTGKVKDSMEIIKEYVVENVGGTIVATTDTDGNCDYVKVDVTEDYTIWIDARMDVIRIQWMEFTEGSGTTQYINKRYKTQLGVINEIKRVLSQALPQIVEVENHQTQLERLAEISSNIPIVRLGDVSTEVDRYEDGKIGLIIVKGTSEGKRVVVGITGHNKGLVFSLWKEDERQVLKNRVKAYGYKFPIVSAWVEYGLDKIEGKI